MNNIVVITLTIVNLGYQTEQQLFCVVVPDRVLQPVTKLYITGIRQQGSGLQWNSERAIHVGLFHVLKRDSGEAH